MEDHIVLNQGDLTVNCCVTEPLGGNIRRIVLGVHGFGGSSRDAIQTGIAEEMGLFGAVTIRFDLPGHGESPMEALTFRCCVESLLAVARYARQRYAQVEDLCIFASGFGACVTLTALTELVELPGKVKLVIQTPAVRMDETLLAMIRHSRETLKAMERIVLPTARPLVITYDFYEELRENGALAEHPIPMLILHGEADDFISMADIRLFQRLNDDAKLVIIPGTSHQFLEEGAWDMVLDLTRDWFEFEQVLLSDWD